MFNNKKYSDAMHYMLTTTTCTRLWATLCYLAQGERLGDNSGRKTIFSAVGASMHISSNVISSSETYDQNLATA